MPVKENSESFAKNQLDTVIDNELDDTDSICQTQDKPENYLKNAEMMIEDDYDSIDGIINNGSKSEELKKLQTTLNQENQEKGYAPISRKQIKSNADRIAHQEQLITNDLNRSKGQALE